MPRPIRDGLLYFPFDTDFFFADKKIKRVRARLGNNGLLFYIYLLTEIYRNGYYIRWDEESVDNAIDDLGLTEGFIEQAMICLTARELITKIEIIDSRQIKTAVITSPGIQKRYQEAVKNRKRQFFVDSQIWLLNEEETESYIKVTHNDSFSEKNQSNSEKNQSNSEKNQLNKIKENKNKLKQRECVQRIEDFISAYPKDCNRYLTETAYIDLLLTGKITEDELVQCAVNYAESCEILETSDRYIKNAENFLRDMVFDKYTAENYKKPEGKKPKNSFNNFKQNQYDYDDLLQKVKIN